MLQRFSNLVVRGHFRLDRLHSIIIVQSKIYISRPIRRILSMSTLETLNFHNKALKELPVDPNPDNRQRQVPGACFSKVKPTPVKNPQLVAYSLPALQLLDLNPSEVERKDFADYFAGNLLLSGSEPAAHCYCGHQFGSFAGQLGDGAAMYLGEILNNAGKRWEMQFKGAGLTPYSRQADGRKVLRSSIREFLCSEALYHLGIPTTRAGTCVTSDSTVIRDIFYNGHPKEEKCTIVLRIAETFIRFGSFEIFKPADEMTGRQGPSVGHTDLLKQLLDYTVSSFYPQIWQQFADRDRQDMYVALFREVIRRTAHLVADWQCVGWCHGVLNTDNMSIVGVTIDYGPFGFMDRYDPKFICNGSDDGGRYSYENQPEICKWNLEKLAEAIQDAVPLQKTKPELEIFDEEFNNHYIIKMRKKLGLLQKSFPEDKELVESFLQTLEETGSDFTNSFRCLSRLPMPGMAEFESCQNEVLEYLLTQCSTVDEMKKSCSPRMDSRQLQMMMMMIQANPGLFSALGCSFAALAAELERMEKLRVLEGETQAAKTDRDGEKWKQWLHKYTDRLRLEAEAVTLQKANQERVMAMNSCNPRMVLRNYIAQNAIDAAEKGDYTEVQRVLKILQHPFDEMLPEDMASSSANTNEAVSDEKTATELKEEKPVASSSYATRLESYTNKPPDWSLDLRVT